jgi:RES domain-containing protein
LRFKGRCFRGHDPAWSFTPLSGEGAAITGGRFNRKGERALYLALDIMTAVSECTQGFSHRLQPLTMCEYDVDCAEVADLRDEDERTRHGVDLTDLSCGWLFCLVERREAPSWLVAERLRKEDFCGVLVPSFVPGAPASHHNLVLWRWGSDLPQRVSVYDPNGRLPKNQTSWS